MKRRNEEKLHLEKEAISIFVNIYNRNNPVKLRLLYQQEKPDAVLQDAKRQKLGLEVTHLFFGSEEAKMLFGRSQETSCALETLDVLVEELNKRIERKEQKISAYSHDYPVALLIRNASPAFGMSNILAVKDRIRKPLPSFVHTWFLSRDGSEEWLLKDLNDLTEAEKDVN
ncbi:hypothetical protein [Paenibacillus sp. MBLB4367]|uniref:hypothetical protein n=1 Tax=Paenibacillus sp. MBLB4367 TaxID=3384767 RepID=UPI0039081A04